MTWLSIVAATKFDPFSSLKQCSPFFYNSGCWKFKRSHKWLKSRCQQGCCFLDASGNLSCLFQEAWNATPHPRSWDRPWTKSLSVWDPTSQGSMLSFRNEDRWLTCTCWLGVQVQDQGSESQLLTRVRQEKRPIEHSNRINALMPAGADYMGYVQEL